MHKKPREQSRRAGPTTPTVYGRRIAAMLETRGMSASELSEQAQVDKSELSKIIHRGRIPTFDKFRRIAKALGCSLSELVSDEPAEEARSADPAPGVEPAMQALPARLRSARKAHGLSQAGLARRAGISPSYVNKVERGLKVPVIETLGRIAAVLGTDAVSLLTSQAAEPGTLTTICDAIGADAAFVLTGKPEPQPTHGGTMKKGWKVTPERWGERHEHAALGLVVDAIRDEAGKVTHVYTRINQPAGSLSLDLSVLATEALAERVKSLRPAKGGAGGGAPPPDHIVDVAAYERNLSARRCA